MELVAFDLRRALRLSELAAEDVQEGLLLQFVGVGSAPAVSSMQCDEHSAERTGGGVGVGEDSSTEVTTRTSELCCAGKRHGANTAETAGRIEWSKAEAAPWCIDVHSLGRSCREYGSSAAHCETHYQRAGGAARTPRFSHFRRRICMPYKRVTCRLSSISSAELLPRTPCIARPK